MIETKRKEIDQDYKQSSIKKIFRIYMFASKIFVFVVNGRNIGVACAVLFCSSILASCSFTHKESALTNENEIEMTIDKAKLEEQAVHEVEIENQVYDQNGVVSAKQNIDSGSDIYNPVKYHNEHFYFSDVDGFKRINKSLTIMETLAEGNVRLGNCDGDFIYYMRIAIDTVDNPGVFRMNLTDLVEEKIMEWSEDMWRVHGIYKHKNIIYLEGGDVCEAYEFINGQISRVIENENILYQKLDMCGISHEDINALAFGYINAMLQYHKLVYFDTENEKIIVYDTDSGEIVNIIDKCESDILVGAYGIVYKDLDNNILLRTWESENDNVLYNISEHNGKLVNYGTYDDHFIYGFYENGNECILVKINWEGECEIGKTFENVNFAVELGFSANNDVISFLNDGRRVFEKVVEGNGEI